MKRLFLIVLTVLLTLSSGCEKDDLCTADQGSSARMIVVFKDAADPTAIKEVENFRIKEIGSSEFAPLDYDGSTIITAADTVFIPLRNISDLTSYNFYTETDDGVNIDNLDFRYIRNEEYVSRACGFKTDYENLTVFINNETPSNLWISSATVVNNAVNNTSEVHVEIRH